MYESRGIMQCKKGIWHLPVEVCPLLSGPLLVSLCLSVAPLTALWWSKKLVTSTYTIRYQGPSTDGWSNTPLIRLGQSQHSVEGGAAPPLPGPPCPTGNTIEMNEVNWLTTTHLLINNEDLLCWNGFGLKVRAQDNWLEFK